jgi:CheY-like chemotaxis protein
MTSRPRKHVLIVDDEPWVRGDLCRKFLRYNDVHDGIFHFEVEVAESLKDAVALIRARPRHAQYDVVVLDLSFTRDENDLAGLRLADALGLYTRLGQTIPATIVFSGHLSGPRSINFTVEVMRCGVWDVIDKTATDAGPGPFQQVVDSAVSCLCGLAWQRELKLEAVKWTHKHINELQAKYAGQVVAIWQSGRQTGVPLMQVVANGKDAFELEDQLHEWRKKEPNASQPYVVWIPALAPAL